MSQDFPFVNVSKTLAIDRQSRLAIRSQVSKDFHRRARTGHVAPSVPSSQGHQIHRFRLKSKQTKRRRNLRLVQPRLKKSKTFIVQPIQKTFPTSEALIQASITNSSPSPFSSAPDISVREKDSDILIEYIDFSMTQVPAPTSGYPDPFDSLCIPSSPQIQYLVHHFKGECTESELMLSYRRQCFRISIGDQALFYLGLSLMAEKLSMFKDDNIGPMDYLVYRTKTIHLVNEKLRGKETAIEDGTINSVAHMAMYEVANGRNQAATTHLLGLEKMVAMRGGLVNTSMSSALRRIILWTDLFASNAMSRLPTAWLSCTANEILSPPVSLVDFMSSLPNPLLSDSAKLEAIFSNFRDISNILESSRGATIERFNDEIYADQVYYIQRELMTLSLDMDMDPFERSRIEYLATAALIYLHLVFFKTPAKSVIIQVMVKRLHGILDDSTYMDLMAEADNGEVIWALTMGGISASTPKERQWFVKRLAEISTTKNSVSQRNGLSQIMWHSLLNPLHDHLWKEVLIRH